MIIRATLPFKTARRIVTKKTCDLYVIGGKSAVEKIISISLFTNEGRDVIEVGVGTFACWNVGGIAVARRGRKSTMDD
jgi:hypothetical protein